MYDSNYNIDDNLKVLMATNHLFVIEQFADNQFLMSFNASISFNSSKNDSRHPITSGRCSSD